MAFFNKFTRQPERQGSEIAQIVDNLNNVLNTRRDYGSFLKDFGIRDLNEYRSRNDIALAVMREVKDNIERYEPRVIVENIAVDKDDNPLRLSFTIQCRVRASEQSLHLSVDTIFGNVSIGC